MHVDDSAADRYRRRRALEAAGFDVADAANGESAREMLAAERADLLLVDVGLPDVNGFDLCREMKETAARTNRDIAVVLISAYFTESEFRVRGLDSGADAYLSEPVSDEELIATLRSVGRRLGQTQEARANERLLDALFEYVPEGITVADAPDVMIRRVSRYGYEIAGRSRDALEGIPSAEHADRWSLFRADGVTPAPPEDLPLSRAVTSGVVVTDEEWVLRRPDGERRTLLCNAGPIQAADGRITGGVIAWRDISARKETEEALLLATRELRVADQAKNDFLATIVHEMRQPIQAAMAGLALMKSRPDRRSGQRARDLVERQIAYIAALVEDLLDATRIVRGQVPLQRSAKDLADLLRRALETTAPGFTRQRVQIATELPPRPVPVHVDGTRMHQVFVNLLSNAARYTPANGRVTVSLSTIDGHAIVRVADTGEGIAPDQLLRIFDLFVRASSQPGGFGIGLAVARSLVEAHGGTIGARSDGPGRGSEFTVSLPLEQTSPST